MVLSFDKSVAAEYKSPAQQARVMTESWVGSQVYCPSCGQGSLNKYPNNTPVGDFFCSKCSEQFELKAKHDTFGTKIVDGEYRTMLRRLRSSEVPNLFALNYDRTQGRVQNLFVIPSQFFVPEIIQRRKPLAHTARRAGWTGCNILFNRIPRAGRVSLVSNGIAVNKPTVLAAWKRTLFLRNQTHVEMRGWALDVMRYLEKLKNSEFTLADIYRFEQELQKIHPNNRHIKAKIRQQLQVLRDAGYLEFQGHGSYRVV